MRILITGSRDWRDRDAIYDDLDQLWDLAGGRLTIVHGWCETGADAIADEWGHSITGVTVERHAALWGASCRTTCPPGHRRPSRHPRHAGTTYCPLAGHYRNQEMVDLGADQVRAYQLNYSRGTQDCIDRAKAAGLTVILKEMTT